MALTVGIFEFIVIIFLRFPAGFSILYIIFGVLLAEGKSDGSV